MLFISMLGPRLGEEAFQLTRSSHLARALWLGENWKSDSGARGRWSSLLSGTYRSDEPFGPSLMAFYYFDLLVDGQPNNQGGMIDPRLVDAFASKVISSASPSWIRALGGQKHQVSAGSS